MERILYFDCFSGISGDMTLGALIDLGIDPEVLKRELNKLNVDGYQLHIEKTQRHAITGIDVDVRLHDCDHDHDHNHRGHEHSSDHHHHHDHDHDHEHEHQDHGHDHEHSRNLYDIKRIIEDSTISPKAKSLALDIFTEIATAEGKVHNKTLDEVHFHEVGAMDSIVDIVGTAICLDLLCVDRICCSPIREGRGFVRCQHGLLPVPVPAVAEMLAESCLSLVVGEAEGELVTPTGFGILKVAAVNSSSMPAMRVEKVGYGFGKKETGSLNALRVFLGTGEDVQSAETITIIETTMDDETGEILGYCMERLMDSGALDAYYTPIYMKKGRPASKLTVLCNNDDLDRIAGILFSETSTIGLRHYQTKRMVLPRREDTISSPLGTVRVKSSGIGASQKRKLEYEDCAKLAREHAIPLKKVYALIAALDADTEK